jgi:PAS domain S-box-containing protein
VFVLAGGGGLLLFFLLAGIVLSNRIKSRTAQLSASNEELRQEIAERERAEEALRESEERYRTVLEANPDPVVVYDIEGKVVYFNPAFSRVFGWELEERLGHNMDHFVPEENWPETRMMIDMVLGGESFSGIDTRRYTKDGDVIPVSISGAVYRDLDGKPVGSVINLRDISEQEHLQAQLQHAQKMEAVGTLAGGVAHDFNNLLQAVQGYTELLLMRKERDGPDFKELQAVRRAAKRGAELTQQLLTFSRRVDSRLQFVDLNHVVLEVKRLLQRTVPKMIDIELHLASDPKLISADPAQLEQVLVNLAVNAKDAMPDGGRLVIETANASLDEDYCKTHLGATMGEYVQLTVSDSGHGMDKGTVEHIFDPFYTTKAVGKGTGLGLAMVYGIVKNHEGYIICYSQPDQGTTFKIYLPVATQERELVAPEEEEVHLSGGTENILLVDDEDFIRELGEEILSKFGYTVVTASDGEGALEIYRQERDRIDLVILDLIMPGIGGKKCLDELMKLDPQLKVLIASGYSHGLPTKSVFEVGALGFVRKPYEIRQMLQVIRRVLDSD